jgi:conjugal transfer pilus assembly protein TraE
MNINEQIKANRNLLKHRNLLVIILVVMLISNTLLAFYLFKVDSKIIVIPSQVRKEFYLTESKVSNEYLELMTRDFTNLILNLTAENYEYVKTSVLKHTKPDYYEKIKHELDGLATDIKLRNVTTTFFIKEIILDTETLTSEVKGVLDTRIGLTTVSSVNKVYKIVFDYSLSYLSLKEFYEVEDGV